MKWRVLLALGCVGLMHVSHTHALDNGLARTPPMGFSTWSVFRSDVNESLVRELADAMESSGLAAAGYNYLLVDGGDQFQGTLFYTYYKGKLAAEMMNKMGYDAMTVGNHEFDDGPEVLRGFVDSVEFPVLMSNADVSGEPLLADAIMKSTIIEKNGEKIGLIGLTPQDTDELASPGPNVIFTPPADAVQKLLKQPLNQLI